MNPSSISLSSSEDSSFRIRRAAATLAAFFLAEAVGLGVTDSWYLQRQEAKLRISSIELNEREVEIGIASWVSLLGLIVQFERGLVAPVRSYVHRSKVAIVHQFLQSCIDFWVYGRCSVLRQFVDVCFSMRIRKR